MDDLFFLNEELEAVEMNTSYDPLPAGTYNVTIIGAENKETNAKNGWYIKLTLEVADGRYQGRRLWENMNYRNPNPMTEEIGKRTLKTVMAHCNIGELRSTDQFLGHSLPVQVTLKKRKDDPNTMENQIRFSPPKGGEQPTPRPATPAQQGAAVAAGAVAAASSASAKPWARRSA